MLKKHYRIGKAVGVAIRLLPDGGTAVNACGVAIDNNLLDITKKVVDLPEIETLKEHFSPKSLIALNLFGKGVLHKKLDKVDNIDERNFAQVLPNANMDDFYIQHFISGAYSYVSLIRKAEADKWIQEIEDLGYIPLLVSLGPFAVENVVGQVNNYDEELVFDGHIIQLNTDKEWISYKYDQATKAPFALKLATNSLPEQLLLPYAAAFQLALSPDIARIAIADALHQKLDIHLSNKRFNVKGFVALVVFFVLLLINFVLFSVLSSSNDELTARLNISARNVSDQQGIAMQIAEKEAKIKSLGWDGGISKSRMIDELATLLPEEVKLTELSVNPVDGNAIRLQKTLSFEDRTIRIVGNSGRIIPVNEWIARIRTLKWLKSVQMDSYLIDRETNTGRFTITISY